MKIFKEDLLVAKNVFSVDGCLDPIATFQQVSKHPWSQHCRCSWSINNYAQNALQQKWGNFPFAN